MDNTVPSVRNMQFNKEWRHQTGHRSAKQQIRLEMFNPKGSAPKDVAKIDSPSQPITIKKKHNNLLAYFQNPESQSIEVAESQSKSVAIELKKTLELEEQQPEPQSEQQSKKGREFARSSKEPSKYDGEFRGGMALPPNTGSNAFNPKGKNPRDVIKSKGYDAYYEAAHCPQSVQIKGHGDKASTVARLAAGLVQNHPLGKNPMDVFNEFQVSSELFDLFLQWVEWQSLEDDVLEICTRSFKGSHFATFPDTLVRDPIRVTCPPNGIVFDPMCGRGTVCRVAFELGFNFLGCDLVPKNIEIAKSYMKVVGQKRLV